MQFHHFLKIFHEDEGACLNRHQRMYGNKGIGKVLLLKSLYAMREQGYGYAIIGGVGPAEYYARTVNAELIKGSNPGIYQGIMSEVPVD